MTRGGVRTVYITFSNAEGLIRKTNGPPGFPNEPLAGPAGWRDRHLEPTTGSGFLGG